MTGDGIWTINPTTFREGFWILRKGQRLIWWWFTVVQSKQRLEQIQVFGVATFVATN